MIFRPSWSLGFLLPLVLVLFGTAELGLRLLPTETFTYRAWEVVTRNPVSGAPFEPNVTYVTASTYGDLAALGNLPAAREYRSERFTTDTLGYRNRADLAQGAPVDAILLGTSFSVGAGLSDDETLAEQISVRGGFRVYNASGPEYFQHTALWRAVALGERLQRRGGLVIYEFLERYDPPPIRSVAEQARLSAALSSPCASGAETGAIVLPCSLLRLVGPTPVSPLRIVTDRAFRHLEDGRFLPNPAAEGVVLRQLRNDDSMLFLPLDLESAERPRSATGTAEYFGWLQQELRHHDLELVVALLPDKSTVYGPLLADPPASSDLAATFLRDLQTSLEQRGVPSVNLLNPLHDAAVTGFDRGEYVYWRDDSHWNARGVKVAADAIVARLSR